MNGYHLPHLQSNWASFVSTKEDPTKVTDREDIQYPAGRSIKANTVRRLLYWEKLA